MEFVSSGVFIVKVTIQLASLILAVKHNVSQMCPKFTDNQRIADIDLCIFICIFVHICVYSFHMCYTWFGAYPNHI
jgi:hypothetical protein